MTSCYIAYPRLLYNEGVNNMLINTPPAAHQAYLAAPAVMRTRASKLVHAQIDSFLTPGDVWAAITSSSSLSPTPSVVAATSILSIGAGVRGWSRRKLGVPRPELAHHVLIELGVVEPVVPLQGLGEEAVQFVPAVTRLVVGCSAEEGFKVGHKVLGEPRYGWKIRARSGGIDGIICAGPLMIGHLWVVHRQGLPSEGAGEDVEKKLVEDGSILLVLYK